eukprot:1145625-Pelagomonas_calceolata.AAC.5
MEASVTCTFSTIRTYRMHLWSGKGSLDKGLRMMKHPYPCLSTRQHDATVEVLSTMPLLKCFTGYCCRNALQDAIAEMLYRTAATAYSSSLQDADADIEMPCRMRPRSGMAQGPPKAALTWQPQNRI